MIHLVWWMETCEDFETRRIVFYPEYFPIRCYPFDVNEAILWLAELTDMVFVFFDPIGQV